MEALAAVNEVTHPATRTLFVTLTWPASFPETPEEWAAILEKWRKRLERRFGRQFPGLWSKEFQRRGAPHYHLVMFPPEGMPIGPLVRVAAEEWYALTGGGFHAGAVKSWKATRAYLGKFQAAERVQHGENTTENTTEPRRTGRSWGWFRKVLLGIIYDRRRLSGAALVTLRRVFRRATRPETGRQRLRGRGAAFTTMSAMIPEAEMMRLLELLGVDP